MCVWSTRSELLSWKMGNTLHSVHCTVHCTGTNWATQCCCTRSGVILCSVHSSSSSSQLLLKRFFQSQTMFIDPPLILLRYQISTIHSMVLPLSCHFYWKVDNFCSARSKLLILKSVILTSKSFFWFTDNSSSDVSQLLIHWFKQWHIFSIDYNW